MQSAHLSQQMLVKGASEVRVNELTVMQRLAHYTTHKPVYTQVRSHRAIHTSQAVITYPAKSGHDVLVAPALRYLTSANPDLGRNHEFLAASTVHGFAGQYHGMHARPAFTSSGRHGVCVCVGKSVVYVLCCVHSLEVVKMVDPSVTLYDTVGVGLERGATLRDLRTHTHTHTHARTRTHT